jgi:hypothetical protein
MLRSSTPITWEVHEYEFQEKSPDWFWALGIITLALAIVALLFSNVLFAFLIVIGALALGFFARREPELLRIEVTERGIRVNALLYPFSTLESFGIDEEDAPKLVLKSQKPLMPYIILPLDGEQVHTVHSFLISHLPEEDHAEPASHKLMNALGF